MKKNIKKILVLILVFSTLAIAHPTPARADAWGSNYSSTLLKETLEEMYKKIQDTIVANLKIAAIRIINGRLQTLLTGSPGKYGGSGSLVISNWQDFVYGTAQRYALAATNDFFTSIRYGVPNALANRVIGPAEKAVEEGVWNAPPDLQNYVAGGDASQIFSGGTQNPWMAWRMAAMPQNDLAFTYLRAMSVKQATYEQQAQLQQAQGIAGQGYKGQESSSSNRRPYTATSSSGGKLTVPPGSTYTGSTQSIQTPGSSIKALTDEILQLPIKMVEYAQTIPQVITSMVTSMISQLIQSGVDKVTAPIDAQIVKARNQVGQSLGQMQAQVQGGIIKATTPSSSSSGTQLFK
jgi:hypothetical protein